MGVSPEEFVRTVATVAATTAELRQAYESQITEGFDGIDDHRPLVVHPICEVHPGTFVPIDYAALGERLIGDGVYWRLRPQDQQGKERYGAVVGRLLEQHLWEVARDVYPVEADTEREPLFREKRFAGGVHGPDIVVFDDDTIMVCEVGANVVNVRDTLHRGSVETFERDLREVLLPRIAQLAPKIEAIRSGAFSYGRAVLPTTRIEPVVCLIDGFPLAPFLRRRIDEAIRESGLLDMPNVGRASVVSAEEFELGCAVVERGRVSITELLAGHAADAELSEWPLRDYIRKVAGELPITQLLSSEFDRVVATAATELSEGE